MSRRTLERRRAAEERWPTLTNMLACFFNEDYNILYGSLDGAFAAAVKDAPLETRRTILREWRDWQTAEGMGDDLRSYVNDVFGVAVRFERLIDARNFMNRVYEQLIVSVRAETATHDNIPL